MAQQLNCPNCGAPLGLSDRCEYCGTWFADFTIDRDKPFYIKIRVGNVTVIDKVMLTEASVETTGNPIYAKYLDGRTATVYTNPQRTYKLELESLGANYG